MSVTDKYAPLSKDETVAGLKAEIKRLRALLKEVHAWMDDGWEPEFRAKIGRELGPRSPDQGRGQAS